MAGATRKANFAAPVRGAYTGVGAARTANRPAAELGNWSTTYTNSYEVMALHLLFTKVFVHSFQATEPLGHQTNLHCFSDV